MDRRVAKANQSVTRYNMHTKCGQMTAIKSK